MRVVSIVGIGECPNWSVYFMENSVVKKWMITGVPPFLKDPNGSTWGSIIYHDKYMGNLH